jgi:hypothetical protein
MAVLHTRALQATQVVVTNHFFESDQRVGATDSAAKVQNLHCQARRELYLCGVAALESDEHLSILRLRYERRPVRQTVALPCLTQVRDPQPRLRMSARPAAAPALRAPDRMADVMDVELVRKPIESLYRDMAAVIADGAGQGQREAERPDLAEQDRRERIATHAESVSRGRSENNVLSYAPEFLAYAGPAIDPGTPAAAAHNPVRKSPTHPLWR